MSRHNICLVILAVLVCPPSYSDDSRSGGNPEKHGTLILGGGGIQGPGAGTESIKRRFVELAGGPDADFVIIQSNRDTLPVDMLIVEDIDGAKVFGVKHMTALCTKKREIADSDAFAAHIRAANAVWITGGKPDNLQPVYHNTATERELRALLDRGGVIGGESAGAMIQASHITDSIKVPPGVQPDTKCYEGFGFVSGVVIAPHIIKMGWTESLVPIIAANPDLLGIGIDERAAIVVQGRHFEVIGDSKVAIYDNDDHDGKRYYFLSPGDRFNLETRRAESKAATSP